MNILAIDTSCDESCAAIVDTEAWQLRADIVQSHISAMQPWGGVVPELASREHLKALPLVVRSALDTANLRAADIHWVAVTNRPGLIGSLLMGLAFSKAFAFAGKIPFSALSHVEAHLFSPWLISFEGGSPPPFPWLALVVSGGHTELFHVEDFSRYQWLGGTLDDAAGEAFDKIGKKLSIEYPAGPQIDKWVARDSTEADRAAFNLPRARVAGLDFSFSGLKTATHLLIQKHSPLSEKVRLQVAASSQEAIVDMCVDKIELARARFPKAQVVVTGGVACNSRLRSKLPDAYFPKPKHCTDNAAMVGLLAAVKHREGKLLSDSYSVSAKATDEITGTYGAS